MTAATITTATPTTSTIPIPTLTTDTPTIPIASLSQGSYAPTVMVIILVVSRLSVWFILNLTQCLLQLLLPVTDYSPHRWPTVSVYPPFRSYPPIMPIVSLYAIWCEDYRDVSWTTFRPGFDGLAPQPTCHLETDNTVYRLPIKLSTLWLR